MSNIPTAEQFHAKFLETHKREDGHCFQKCLIEFTKLHVEAALKAAGKIANEWENSGELKPVILSAYPLNLIQ